jgi:hypothetical protein
METQAIKLDWVMLIRHLVPSNFQRTLCIRKGTKWAGGAYMHHGSQSNVGINAYDIVAFPPIRLFHGVLFNTLFQQNRLSFSLTGSAL